LEDLGSNPFKVMIRVKEIKSQLERVLGHIISTKIIRMKRGKIFNNGRRVLQELKKYKDSKGKSSKTLTRSKEVTISNKNKLKMSKKIRERFKIRHCKINSNKIKAK